MTSEDIEKLAQADKLMFNLNSSKNPKEDILKVGQFLKEAGVLQDDTDDLKVIVDTYNQNARDEIKKAIRKRMAATVQLNLKAIKACLNSKDSDIADSTANCLDHFKDYGQIVLRFNEKKATWQAEKSGDEFRQLFHALDQRRHDIHNDCILDITVLSRTSQNKNLKVDLVTWDNPNIKLTDIPRSDIGNAILELYLEELTQNEKKVLENL